MEELHRNITSKTARRYRTDAIVLLEALSLFLPPDKQPGLLLVVKIMEIQQIMREAGEIHGKRCQLTPDDYEEVFTAIRPSLTEETARKLDQAVNMISMFKTYQQLKDLMDVMEPVSAGSDPSNGQDDNGEIPGQDVNTSSGSEMLELLKSVIPPENQAMVEMLLQMNH